MVRIVPACGKTFIVSWVAYLPDCALEGGLDRHSPSLVCSTHPAPGRIRTDNLSLSGIHSSMKAVAVYPGQANSVHLEDNPPVTLDNIPVPAHAEPADPARGVLVRVLKVGVDATDREINDALYGNAPVGTDHLVIGHECFGVVEEIGSAVRHVQPGDYVTATVRRPGSSIYDVIGTNDMTSEKEYYERGINLLPGYLTENFVDDAEYIVKIPPGLKHLHVLMEPMSCATKAICQVFEAQQRMRVWRPQQAFVMGAGQIGLMATLILRLRGLEVYTIARRQPPRLPADIVEAMGAHYISTELETIDALAARVGHADIIMEASGSSEVAFRAMQVLANNGAMVWHSITGADRQTEVPIDRINIEWVLGNKLLLGSVNANRTHFEQGIKELALGEVMFPGVILRILTHPVDGLENYALMMSLLVDDPDALKVYVNVADM